MSQWKALTGRITLFPSLSTSFQQPNAIDLYTKIWGAGPDNFQKQQNPFMPNIAQGKRDRMVAVCSCHPTRIDLSLTPAGPLPSEITQASLRLIENTGLLHSELTAIVDAIGKGIIAEPVARVALYIQFLKEEKDFKTANQSLIEVIPGRYGVKVSDDEEDFIFQINQPYNSNKVTGFRVNSVTKWSVDRMQVVTFAIQAGGTGSPAPSNTSSSMKPTATNFITASVSFDINNAIDPNSSNGRNLLNLEKQSTLLREALSTVGQQQKDYGLNVEGFENA